MMSCNEVLELHSEYIDGVLDADTTLQVRTHLDGCSDCARYDHTVRKGTQLFLRQSTTTVLDSDFLQQLHTRIAEEDERMAFRPISINAGASVSIAAVLALAAWVPVMMKHMEDTSPNRDVQRAAVAFSVPAPLPSKPFPTERPQPKLVQTTADAQLIDRGYSPLILESPTAPPSYVRLTSLETR